MEAFEYSGSGLAMTCSFEGLRLDAYQDSVGRWTIGYGHTGPEVHAGQSITEAEAEELLRRDVASAVACVQQAVQVSISQAQFDALVDFCFNAGRGNFLSSTLLKMVNRGDFAAAADQFGLWVHAGPQVCQGLVRRRAAEAALFAGRSPTFELAANKQPQTNA